MTQSPLIVSETEAAERLETLIALALQGQQVIVEADTGERIALVPVNDDEAG